MTETVVTAVFHGATLDDVIDQAQRELEASPLEVYFSKIDVSRFPASTLFEEGEPTPGGTDKEGWAWVATLTVKGWV